MFLHATSTKNPKGFIVIAVSVVITALLFISGYLVEQSFSESRIAKSENSATKAYYIAESGVNEAIYLLKNNPTWRLGFLSGTLNNEIYSRNNVFDNNGSYSISATSIASGLVDITVTGYFSIGNEQSQRVIKTRLARATGTGLNWSQSFYAGGQGAQQNGNLTIERNCTINGGKIHANQLVKVTSKSTLTVNNAQVSASNNIIVNNQSTLVLNNSTQSEGTSIIALPQVDIDSPSPTSLKNRANQTYTSTAFSALPSGTVLNGITFVTGNANWNNKNITINGILAASGNITVNLSSGNSFLINVNGGTGSGLISKSGIYLNLNSGNFTANGLLYTPAAISVNFNDTNPIFDLTGGLIGWHVTFSGNDNGTCVITYNQDVLSTPLDPVYNGNESPIIEVNHWEEQY